MRRLASAVLVAASASLAPDSSAADSDFGSVKYGAGKVYKTGVYKPQLLATLPSKGTEPVLVLSGLGCTECDINLSVYIHSPAQGSMAPGERAPRYTYPGRYHDYMSQALVETVRMFVGQCTPDEKHGVVWFQNSKKETGKWERSTYLVQVEGVAPIEHRQAPREVSLQAALSAVARGNCREIQGRRFTTEP